MFQFECCGTNNASDWIRENVLDKLPMSCCRPLNGAVDQAFCNLNSTNLFRIGCLTNFGVVIKAHAVQLGGVGLGVAFVQVTNGF